MAIAKASMDRMDEASRGVNCAGGEGGIRTHGGASTTTVFETARINRSRTSPQKNGALGGNRTPYALLRTEALYPVSYEGAQAADGRRLSDNVGAAEGTRTPDLKVRNLSLYPLSYSRASIAS